MTEQMLSDKMDQMIRVGFVNARQPEKMRVKVTIPDTTGGKLITNWLPVLCPRASRDMQYDLPDIGDQVLCLFLSYGHEQGFVVGAMYGAQVPPVQNGDKWHRTFSDGTFLEYDRAEHKLLADVKGDVELIATGSVSGRIEKDLSAQVRGSIQASADGPAAIASKKQLSLDAPAMSMGGGDGKTTSAGMKGTFKITQGDMIAEGVSLLNHVHTCPACGADTSKPVGGGGGGDGGSGTGSGDSSGDSNTDDSNSGNGGDNASKDDDSSENFQYGYQMDEKAQASFRELADDVNNRGDKTDSLILCLPQISGEIAKTKEYEDKNGWLYLEQMFKKWLTGTKNENALICDEPFWIDWNWAIKFHKFKTAYNLFTNDTPVTSRKILNKAAKISLGTYLCDNHYMIYGHTVGFDFIGDKKSWRRWEKDYHSSLAIQVMIPGTDGISAALGAFSLRALASGSVEWLEGYKYRIHIDRIAVILWDSFNFKEETGIIKKFVHALFGLGDWSCEKLDMINPLSGIGEDGYTRLDNGAFNKFREKFKKGSDFMVLTEPHLVENFKGASYDFSCTKQAGQKNCF